MQKSDNIYLVGPMGVGKTTVGRRLAELLGRDFYDVDQEVEAHTGTSINIIFDVEGEPGFRTRETRMLEDLSAHLGAVIATGGGAVKSNENRDIMRRHGKVVYLHADVNTQVNRTRFCRNRPMLQDTDRKRTLTKLMQEREPLYRELADCVIVTDRRPAHLVAREIAKKLEAK